MPYAGLRSVINVTVLFIAFWTTDGTVDLDVFETNVVVDCSYVSWNRESIVKDIMPKGTDEITRGGNDCQHDEVKSCGDTVD